MVAVPVKWKAVTLQEKLNFIQKVEANLITCVQMFMIFLLQFLGGLL
jgi:hypothetical protein